MIGALIYRNPTYASYPGLKLVSTRACALLLALVAAIFLVDLAVVPNSYASPAKQLQWLRADGGSILNEDGQQIVLRGANLPTLRYYQNVYIYVRLLDAAKSLGFNVVRLPVLWSELEPAPGKFRSQYVELIQKIVTLGEQRQLYTVLDMHQYLLAEKFGGDGFPSWALARFQSMDAAILGFWNDPNLQNELAKAWKTLATAFKNTPAVAAYDLMNEPLAGPIAWEAFAPVLNGLYETIIREIRTVDSRHSIMFEPVSGVAIIGEHISLKPRASNIIFSPHMYLRGPTQFVEYTIQRLHQLSRGDWNIPVWIGELGGVAIDIKDSHSIRNLNATLNALAKHGIGWAYWSLDLTSSGPKLVDANGQSSRLLTEMIRNAANPVASGLELVSSSPRRSNNLVSIGQFEASWELSGGQEYDGLSPQLGTTIWQASFAVFAIAVSVFSLHLARRQPRRKP
jgi:hypothetical protein